MGANKLFLIGPIVLFLANAVVAQCDNSKNLVINVPTDKSTITAAISATKSDPLYKGKRVKIDVSYGVYEEGGKGILIDRPCLDLIGISNAANEKPVIRRGSFDGFEQAVVRIRESDIRFENFDIDGQQQCNAYGILALIATYDEDIKDSLHNILIQRNRIRDIGRTGCKEDQNQSHGIVIWSAKEQSIDGVMINDNFLTNLRLGKSEAITIKNNVQHFHVTENTIQNTDNIGIDIIGLEGGSPYQARDGEIFHNSVTDLREGNSAYPFVAGIYIDGGIETDITHNLVKGFGFGIEIASELLYGRVSGIVVDHNTFAENLVVGIGIGHDTDQRGYVENCKITNNVIVDNGIGVDGKGGLEDGGQIRLKSYLADGLTNILVENNSICISAKQRIKHIIYLENCLLNKATNKYVINPQKVGVSFNHNRFYTANYQDAWYVAKVDEIDGNDSGAISQLNKYLTFGPGNLFGAICP